MLRKARLAADVASDTQRRRRESGSCGGIGRKGIQPAAASAKTGKIRIVLDAGHGGWDLGTVGQQGLLEKDLVLDVAQRLGKLLQARLGSEVMFTRTGDTYLPLDQRADFANQAQADLFVSVHANYSSSATARGVETYYTNCFPRRDRAKSKSTTMEPGQVHAGIVISRRFTREDRGVPTSRGKCPAFSLRHAGGEKPGHPQPGHQGLRFCRADRHDHALHPYRDFFCQQSGGRAQSAELDLSPANRRSPLQGIARYQQSSPHAKVAQLQTAGTRR